jgi:predicted MPP superfamily phosphohydrolase
VGSEMIVTRYRNPGKHLGLRLALVTDLHNCPWDELVHLLRDEKPDAILCAGDILERHDETISPVRPKDIERWVNSIGKRHLTDYLMWVLDRLTEHNGRQGAEEDIAIEFLKEIPDIAPTFYSVGNHEWYFLPADYRTFSEHGITILDNADCLAEVKSVKLRIGGLSTRYAMAWLKKFSLMDGYKILMCHHPDYYRKAIKGTTLDIFDLVVSGHYHGGQWRIKDRAVYVPRTGLFMKNAVGQFGKHIISAGVANTTRFPRYGNPCELVMIEI